VPRMCSVYAEICTDAEETPMTIRLPGIQGDHYRTVWDFVHSEKLTYKKRRWSPASATGRM
jgi:hypothetical protein